MDVGSGPLARTRDDVAALVLIAAGTLTAVGCLLPWYDVTADLGALASGRFTEAVGGLDTPDGPVFLGMGLAIVGVGLLLTRTRTGWPARLLAFAGTVGALTVAAWATYDALTPQQQAVARIAGEVGSDAEETRAVLEGFLEAELVWVDTAVGLWVVVIAACVASAAATVRLTARWTSSALREGSRA